MTLKQTAELGAHVRKGDRGHPIDDNPRPLGCWLLFVGLSR
jgi:hypothetical protein